MGGELISTEALARILHEPDLRIFDCTTRLDYQPAGSDIPYMAVPGLDTFEGAHIPGADFLDIQGEFSDQDTRLRFMMAGTAELEAAFRRHGVANDSRVVLYSLESPMWATRF
jgi:thiosulfate/3-mercaptopyruvate sulfurtransferase